jgi:hypothetical protein
VNCGCLCSHNGDVNIRVLWDVTPRLMADAVVSVDSRLVCRRLDSQKPEKFDLSEPEDEAH